MMKRLFAKTKEFMSSTLGRIATVAAIVAGVLLAPSIALANGFSSPGLGSSGLSGGSVNSLYYFGEIIVYIIFGFAGIVTVVMLIWNGYKIMGGSSNPQKRAEGVSGLLYVGIGALITFGAWTGAGAIQDAANRASTGQVTGSVVHMVLHLLGM